MGKKLADKFEVFHIRRVMWIYRLYEAIQKNVYHEKCLKQS